MKSITPAAAFPTLSENLPKGSFLVTGTKENPNVMLIGWGASGIFWGKQVLIVPVRLSRYSHEKLNEVREFTVCVPATPDALSSERKIAGTESGRTGEKLAHLGLTLVPSEVVSTPSIQECALIYECRVLYELEMAEAHLDRSIVSRYYAAGDYHTLYFAEIVACRAQQ